MPDVCKLGVFGTLSGAAAKQKAGVELNSKPAALPPQEKPDQVPNSTDTNLRGTDEKQASRSVSWDSTPDVLRKKRSAPALSPDKIAEGSKATHHKKPRTQPKSKEVISDSDGEPIKEDDISVIAKKVFERELVEFTDSQISMISRLKLPDLEGRFVFASVGCGNCQFGQCQFSDTSVCIKCRKGSCLCTAKTFIANVRVSLARSRGIPFDLSKVSGKPKAGGSQRSNRGRIRSGPQAPNDRDQPMREATPPIEQDVPKEPPVMTRAPYNPFHNPFPPPSHQRPLPGELISMNRR